ncbi:MAG: DUF935 family protein [Abditibacteriota bacterium]|nr:DUF935 family protein [Abditibacteriota bacterium]
MKLFEKIKKHFWSGGTLSAPSFELSTTKMLKDPQVKACINIKKQLILQGKQEVHPTDKDSLSLKQADFIRETLYESDDTVSKLLFTVLDAFIYGFSVQEILYKKKGGKVVIDKFCNIDPSTVTVSWDLYGNISQILVNGEECPREKLILYIYNPRPSRPLGTGDLISAYSHFDAKSKLLSFYNIYMEKYVSPVVKGSYKRGLSQSQQTDLLNIMKTIRQKTALLIPEECNVDYMNLNTGGGATFKEAIDYHDRQIAKAILGQTIFTNDNVTVGSYSLANIHLELLNKCLQNIKRDMEESVMAEQVIKPLIKYNFGTEKGPLRSIRDIDGDSLKKNSDAILSLINKGVVKRDEYWIREFLGIPEA